MSSRLNSLRQCPLHTARQFLRQERRGHNQRKAAMASKDRYDRSILPKRASIRPELIIIESSDHPFSVGFFATVNLVSGGRLAVPEQNYQLSQQDSDSAELRGSSCFAIISCAPAISESTCMTLNIRVGILPRVLMWTLGNRNFTRNHSTQVCLLS